MLEILSKGFNQARDRLQGRIELTEANLEDALRDIRVSLLEADVNYTVVKDFIAHVKEKALGEVVETKVSYKGQKLKASPEDHFINICYEELVSLMGPVDTSIKRGSQPVSSIMLVGLQGSGKTTTAGKLARFLETQEKKPLLVAADPYRPAAVEQLRVIGSSLNLPVFFKDDTPPPELCRQAIAYARENGCDTAIFDTAGRLAIDDSLMMELEDIVKSTRPENIFLVCDAMIGQDSVKTAQEFNRRLDLSGFILTKLDGDARGGAALSIKELTGKPIKFLGMGESLDKLEEFRPEGLASRILGFGDVVGLMQDFERVVDEKKAEEDAMRMLKGAFTLDDFLEQLQSIKKMGSLSDLVEKIPGFSQITKGASVDDRELVKVESIINSMTIKERQQPTVLNESRVTRISKGSGRTRREVHDLMKRFNMMRDVMKKIGGGGFLSRIPGLNKIPGLGAAFNPSELMGAGLPALNQGSGGGTRSVSSSDRKKQKAKRKQAKKDRKKSKKR
jgi:signal recognition particle subunit SRP54